MFSKVIRSARDRLTSLYLHLATIFMVILVFSTFMQVFTRYVLNASWPWTEELARYSFIWMNMLGAAAGFRKASLVAVDNMVKIAKGFVLFSMKTIIMAATFAIGFILFWYGNKLIGLVGSYPSVTMRIPMGFIHAASPASGIGFMLNALAGFIEAIEVYKKGGAENE